MKSSATTLVDLFQDQDNESRVHSDLLFHSPSGKLSYREARSSILTLAAFFQELGLMKRDKVYLTLENGPQFIISFFAILKAGATVVLLSGGSNQQKAYPADDSDLIWTVSRPSLSSKQSETAALDPWDASVFIKKTKNGLEQDNISFENIRYFVPNNTWSPLPEVDPTDLAVIWKDFNETRKENTKTHHDFIKELKTLSESASSRQDRFLAINPLNHNGELIQHLLLPIFLGATIYESID